MGEPIDDDELNEELENLEQEQLDNAMIGTGPVPVSDQVHRLPAAPNTESKWKLGIDCGSRLTPNVARSKGPVHVQEDDEEEELRKLQAEMAM